MCYDLSSWINSDFPTLLPKCPGYIHISKKKSKDKFQLNDSLFLCIHQLTICYQAVKKCDIFICHEYAISIVLVNGIHFFRPVTVAARSGELLHVLQLPPREGCWPLADQVPWSYTLNFEGVNSLCFTKPSSFVLKKSAVMFNMS